MNTTYELNNLRKDSDIPGRINKQSPIVEVFSAMVNGEELSKFGAKADKAVSYIKELGSRADAGDFTAVAELNSLRRFVVEAPIMQELKLLSIFGSYQHVGFDETVEREVWDYAGEPSRIQAAGGDVPYASATKNVYPVPTFTVSGGYSVDYRRISLGDMDKENEGLARVKTDIMNRAIVAIINKVYKALNAATGVKYHAEGAPMTKTSVDGVLRDIRGFGKPTVLGSYAILSQFTPWAGYVGKIDTNTITGVSEKTMNEIAQNGMLSMYNGAVLAETPNPYDLSRLNADGSNFAKLAPDGLAFVIPAGGNSPIATWSRGGLTSFTGNNVRTGRVETRFDIELAVDVAQGREYQVGTLYDTSIGGLSV